MEKILASVLSIFSSGLSADPLRSMAQALVILLCVLGILVVLSIALSASHPFRNIRSRGSGMALAAILSYMAAVAVLLVTCCSGLILYRYTHPADERPAVQTPKPSDSNPGNAGNFTPEDPTGDGAESAPSEPETVFVDPRLSFEAVRTESGDPANYGIEWEIMVDDEIVENYQREDPISFDLDAQYFSLPGLATFRGNNYRDQASYGTATVSSGTLSTVWSTSIGMLDGHGGCCWTGQPLIVQWDNETKAIMNLYQRKKEKEDLVEVIYATLDGYIHFYDMDDGSKTRDPIYVGMNFKGAGALDPRGYPLMYVGAGYNTNGNKARMYIISLIDGSILYQAGNGDSFALRTNWSAFDSSPLVDADTDTLIWPGENGILYTYRLNTEYDKEAGTISVNPSNIVKTRYSSDYSRSGRYLGYESSASIVGSNLYVSENGGLVYCMDVNTMELIWVQDTKDDSNSSPVFQWGSDGSGYIYTAPSLHWTANKSSGAISIYKLDAATGNILWTYEKQCTRDSNISGGVQSTPVLGRDGTTIEGMVIYTIACTPSFYKGVVTALDTETGKVIWEVNSGNYAWSSPVALYTEDGKAYIFFVNASGVAQLLDGATGETLYNLKLTGTTEASPVVFNNTIIIGTRENIYCLKVS